MKERSPSAGIPALLARCTARKVEAPLQRKATGQPGYNLWPQGRQEKGPAKMCIPGPGSEEVRQETSCQRGQTTALRAQAQRGCGG
jgi:hypothetical protein